MTLEKKTFGACEKCHRIETDNLINPWVYVGTQIYEILKEDKRLREEVCSTCRNPKAVYSEIERNTA